MDTESIDLLISFDTTGSMYPCLTEVRRKVTDTVKRLRRDIPNVRIGIIAHGDYCDGPNTITKLDFSTDEKAICRFVETVRSTNGGDAPECYELVLHEARSFSWSAGRSKALVLIGDDIPHSPYESQNFKKLDWRNELKLLLEAGIHVHAVQALGRRHATGFYKEVARITGGFHLELAQFSNVVDLLTAVAYRQVGTEQVQQYQDEVTAAGRMSRSMFQVFSTLLGTDFKLDETKTFGGKADLEAVPPSRFQVLHIGGAKTSIKDFVEKNHLRFQTGRGFYELSKTEEIQDHKEVVLQDRSSGDMFSGSKARELLGLPKCGTMKITPKDHRNVLAKYRVFIQSTSNNRALVPDTCFLYEVLESDEAVAA